VKALRQPAYVALVGELAGRIAQRRSGDQAQVNCEDLAANQPMNLTVAFGARRLSARR
jgi:hypothetical protein